MSSLENTITKNGCNPLFRELRADDPDPELTEIESLCVQCRENGMTRLLLTKIPFYREVVIVSFECSHCGWENKELQSVARIQETGIRYNLKVLTQKDLVRQVVKTEWATIKIPELEFEIPACTQEGVVTTIEGIIERAITGISSRQKDLQVEDPDGALKVSEFLSKFMKLKDVDIPFHFVLDDPSGNSFVENVYAPQEDPNLKSTSYQRTREEDKLLGIAAETSDHDSNSNLSTSNQSSDNIVFDNQLNDEVLSFPTNCSFCNTPCKTNMKLTKIPHFKEVVIMATSCDACGHRTSEVKSGAGIEPLGTKIIFQLTDTSDMRRDVLKSETCSITIPELELEVGPAALGGRFTTLEGLLIGIKEQLQENNPLVMGDSADPQLKQRMKGFLGKIDEIIVGKRTVTVILDDPCGNSYLQNFYAPEHDPHLNVVRYERTFEQNEELGLNDMKTSNYTDLASS